MKKFLSLFLVAVLIACLIPTSMADSVGDIGLQGTPSPSPIVTPVATATAEFTYIQDDAVYTENVTVEKSSVTGSKAEVLDIRVDELVKKPSTDVEEKNVEEKTEHDSLLVSDEDIVTQSTKEETIQTVVSESETVIEGENASVCSSHKWGTAVTIREASTTECGIQCCYCSNQGCKAVMYKEIPVQTGPIDKEKTETTVEESSAPAAESATAAETEEITKASGKIDNKDTDKDPTYTYENNILTFSGDGAIPDYKVTITNSDSTKEDVPVTEVTPWAAFANKIIEVIIGSGITRIGDFAFASLLNLQQVDVYSKDVVIGDYAFAGDTNLTNVNFLDKKAEPVFDHADATVTSTDDSGKENTDTGSTAFYDDGTVSVNYSCVNPNKTEMKTNQKFSFVQKCHTDLHLNCSVIPGYAPTETEYGRTDGLYCNDCKQTITAQQVIYPNGKAESGKYNIVDFSKLKEVPKSLEDTKYDTLEKVAQLQEEITDALATEFKAEFNTELLKGNTAVYDIELVELNTVNEPDTYVVNIPYPSGTSAATDDFVSVQLKDDGEIEAVDTFLTNKGIQIEVETLKPVGVAWKNK